MDPFNEALAAALKLLGSRDRFAGEIRAALAVFPSDAVDRVVEHLDSKGILNDRRLAHSLSEKLRDNPAKLRAELERRGAPDDLVAECLADAGANEEQAALAALAAKYGTGVPRAKAGRFLAARGFGEEAVEWALDRFLES